MQEQSNKRLTQLQRACTAKFEFNPLYYHFLCTLYTYWLGCHLVDINFYFFTYSRSHSSQYLVKRFWSQATSHHTYLWASLNRKVLWWVSFSQRSGVLQAGNLPHCMLERDNCGSPFVCSSVCLSVSAQAIPLEVYKVKFHYAPAHQVHMPCIPVCQSQLVTDSGI